VAEIIWEDRGLGCAWEAAAWLRRPLVRSVRNEEGHAGMKAQIEVQMESTDTWVR
jgi:hypothetical protein